MFRFIYARWTRKERLRRLQWHYIRLLSDKSRWITSNPWRPVNSLCLLLLINADTLINQREMDLLIDSLPTPYGVPINWLEEILPNKKLLVFLKFCRANGYELKIGHECAFAISHFHGHLRTVLKKSPPLRRPSIPVSVQINKKTVTTIDVPEDFYNQEVRQMCGALPEVAIALNGRHIGEIVLIESIENGKVKKITADIKTVEV